MTKIVNLCYCILSQFFLKERDKDLIQKRKWKMRQWKQEIGMMQGRSYESRNAEARKDMENILPLSVQKAPAPEET